MHWVTYFVMYKVFSYTKKLFRIMYTNVDVGLQWQNLDDLGVTYVYIRSLWISFYTGTMQLHWDWVTFFGI